jgi:hypothetical protein
MKKEYVCYLCGNSIVEMDLSRDHVPAGQFFPKIFRTINEDKLWKLPAHKSCNNNYHLDEEYFFFSLVPLTYGTPTGEEMWAELKRRFDEDADKMRRQVHEGKTPRGSWEKLGHQVKKEFKDRTPGGIILPGGKIVKDIDRKRIYNVLWKVVQGLCYRDFERLLIGDFKPQINEHYPGDELLDCFKPVVAQEKRGIFHRYFDYTVLQGKAVQGHFYIWALGFWTSICYFVSFTDENCQCEKCLISLKK